MVSKRILPGADRMYPDTDLPPKKITDEQLNKIKQWLPEQFWVREKWYRELGIPEDTVSEASTSYLAEIFKLCEEVEGHPLPAVFLIQYPKRLRKKGLLQYHFTKNLCQPFLKVIQEGE